MDDPWGFDQPPATTAVPPLPPGLAAHERVARAGIALRVDEDYIEPEQLPEVQALIDEGWTALSDAPVDYLVPASWPRQHRCWVPDRTPDAYDPGRGTDTYYAWIRPRATSGPIAWSRDEEVADLAETAGLPAFPPGRQWLLRSPWPGIEVGDVLDLMVIRAERPSMAVGHDGPPDFLTSLRRLLALTRDEIAAAIRAELEVDPFRFVGLDRVGRKLVELGIDPSEFEQWRAETGLSAEALLAWIGSTRLADADITRFVQSWRRSGLPGDPPRDAARFVGRDVGDVRSYLDAGFTLYDADLLEHVGLARAIAWREAGFSEADTYELLRCDPELSIEEARGFERDELRESRKGWIYWGFTASEASGWSAAGLSVGRARLWRAGGHTPGDVPRQSPEDILVSVPPEFRPSGPYFAVGGYQGHEMQMDEWQDVQDPPGTRGRGARRRRGDLHPWIQTD